MKLTGVRLGRSLGALDRPLKAFGARRPGLFLAGGAVRDALRGVKVHDIDVAVATGSAVAAGRAFAGVVRGALVVLGKEKLARVIVKGATVDFTPLRAGTIELDLTKRDFTVNAMAVAIPWDERPAILDPTGGRGDLKGRRLAACGPKVFEDDPVRLWRAHRAEAGLGLRMTPATRKAVERDAPRAASCPPERLRDELFKLLGGPRTATALRAASASGVLAATFPDLGAMVRVPVPGGRPIDVLDHTLEAMEHLDRALPRLRRRYMREGGEMIRHLETEPVAGRPRVALLKLALLLHDVAKPPTVSRDRKGNVHFYGHETRGARRAAELMRARLRCAGSEIEAVGRIIRHHLRVGYLAAAPRFTDRAAYRLIRDAGDELFELILHGNADRLATHHYRGVSAGAQGRTVRRILSLRRAMLARRPKERLVSGHDLLREFGLKPGPIVGTLLRAVEEGVDLGRIRSREEALRAARKVLDRSGG